MGAAMGEFWLCQGKYSVVRHNHYKHKDQKWIIITFLLDHLNNNNSYIHLIELKILRRRILKNKFKEEGCASQLHVYIHVLYYKTSKKIDCI